MTWRLSLDPEERLEDQLTDRLVEHNQSASEAFPLRFEEDNLRARAVQAYATDEAGRLIGGCTGNTVEIWQWLTVDTMWVDSSRRRQGIGRTLLDAVEDQARARNCRWAKLNTWEFQAPDFYQRLGYVVYGRELDYPPGHINYLMRKDL
ncbi:MAG TPA: GNAT family N-acetyltransferase [Nocardioides sp.]|nr:GNAT family N-acetyltransferase [Nocardioides sp.]